MMDALTPAQAAEVRRRWHKLQPRLDAIRRENYENEKAYRAARLAVFLDELGALGLGPGSHPGSHGT